MSQSTSLRLLLVEDDELFRLGLSMALQRDPELKVVAEAVDGETAIELTNQYQPDVVLLDIGLPGIGGIEACQRIKQQHPNLPVLVLTSHSEKPLIEQLIQVGASGFCLKGIEAETLILALRSVVAGASWWDQKGTSEIRAAFSDPIKAITGEDEVLEYSLTQREQEILALIALGKTNQEIAKHLLIAPGTVRVHVHAILQKLDVRDRTQAAILALQKGLVTHPPSDADGIL